VNTAGSQRKVQYGRSSAECPVHVDSDGVWQVRDVAAARAVLRCPDTRQGGFAVDKVKLPTGMRPPVIWRDGPEHREDRRQTARFFTPRRVDEKYRDLMDRLAAQQCDRLRRQGAADLSQLSFDLAVAVISEIVGLTPRRRGTARRLETFFSETRVDAGIYGLFPKKLAIATFYLLDVRPAIRVRRARPQDDLVSHLLAQGATDTEILAECIAFATAGMATTREYVTIVAWHLLSDDALRAAYLAADQAARYAILHEILRLEPVVRSLFRWTTDDVRIPAQAGPVTIPARARIEIDISAANLDSAVVGTHPLLLRPGRPLPDGVAASVLSFGDGPHRCPGAYLAIQETDIFLTRLLALPDVRMVRAPRVNIRQRTSGYGLRSLIVTVGRPSSVAR
jgi:cytochrome P450